MNIFKESHMDADESIQANRLDEALDIMLSGKQSEFDKREDPELSELTAVGSRLQSASAEATSRSSFKSFHMRSRAAILHKSAEFNNDLTESTNGVIGIFSSLFAKRTMIGTALGSSVATLLVVVALNGVTSGDSEQMIAAAEPVFSAAPEVRVSQTEFQSEPTSNSESRETNSQLIGALDFSDNVPIQAANSPSTIAVNSETVQNTQAELSPFSLPIIGLTSSIEQLRLGIESDDVVVENIWAITDELALIGFEMRSNHPGAKYPEDLEAFQNAIVQAILILRSVDQQDETVRGALIAAKIVAEETMHIATTYVYANQVSR